MRSKFRYVAPAGAPIGVADLARWVARLLSGENVSAGLAEALKARLGVRHAFLTSTGRAGLTVLLQAMRHQAPPERNEVVVPAYTCYSVAASVVKAGLIPRVVDISAGTLDYDREDLEATDFSHVLALVATNLYGLPNDLPGLSALARTNGVFLIDDAAQALGASVGGRPSGTWGDAGLYSFDKGKNVSAIDGGVIVTQSDDLAASLQRQMDALPSQGVQAAAMMIAKAVGYSVMLRPWLYWIPQSLPQLELGQTVFTTDFSLARPTRPESALAETMLSRLEQFTGARIATAASLLDGLRTADRLTPVQPLAGTSPVYLRLPLLAADEASRQRLLARLGSAGIGATGSYPRSISEIPGIARASGSRGVVVGVDVARRILTLPTHPFVTPSDIRTMLDILMADAVDGAAGTTRAA